MLTMTTMDGNYHDYTDHDEIRTMPTMNTRVMLTMATRNVTCTMDTRTTKPPCVNLQACGQGV